MAAVSCRIAQYFLGSLLMANQIAKAASSKPAKQQMPAAAPGTQPSAGSKPNLLLGSSLASVTAEMRRTMIAEAAYFIAERRGFGSGRDVDDWLLAEKQIDATLST